MPRESGAVHRTSLRSRSRATAGALVACCVAFGGPRAGAAQDNAAAFESLRLDLNLVANVNRTSLHDFWKPGPGAELAVETPFYRGTIEIGIQYSRFQARQTAQPDFTALFPFLGWGLELPMTARLDWHNSGRLGSFVMGFDITGGGRTEQELALALRSRLAYALNDAWSLHVAAHYQVVFTHERLHLFYISGGIGRVFDMPGWLREFLD